MKHGKLDGRNTGYGDFKYHVVFSGLREAEKFCEIREWCWQQWGPSCELEIYYKLKKDVPWSWINDQYRLKIFFRDNAEYQWFLLKWNN